jgi:hypothetical protein
VKHIGSVLRGLLQGILLWMALPFIGGGWYALCGDHEFEQQWLDQVVVHMRSMREQCDDPDLQGILDYAIRRYHRAGAWDVMVAPCVGVYPRTKTIGLNFPFCPGITIDPEVLGYTPREGALVIVHESLHDYWPFFAHGHIRERDTKLALLSQKVHQ